MKTWLKVWLPRILVGLAAAVLFYALGRAAWMFLQYGWKVVAFPYPVDYGEGPILDQVMRAARFENIYQKNLSGLPFTISNYPPLYILAQVPFAWIAGAAYWYGRGLSFLSVLAAGLLIGLTLYTLTKNWLAGVVGGLMLTTMPYILHWAPFSRVDLLALGLSWAGLFVVTRWGQTKKGLIWGAALLTAAVFTRQSYGLAAPMAAFVFLLSEKPRKRALVLAGWALAFGVVGLAVVMVTSRGGFFFNIVTSNVNKFVWQTVEDYANKMWDKMPVLIVACGLFLVGAVWFKVKAWWLAAPYLLGAAASAVTIGKAGSNVNYLYELSAAFALIAGAYVGMPGKKVWWLRIPILLALAWQVNAVYDWARTDYYQNVMNRVDHEGAQIGELLKVVQQADGPVLADEFMGLVPLGGKQLVFQPFEYRMLSLAGAWDQQPMVDAIRSKEFAVILLYDTPYWNSRGERWTEEQNLAIEANYIKAGRYADTLIYIPYSSKK